ncbi:type I restriction-modification system subunit M [Brachyspira aalborgi]|uniref:site-specific DNA-methyltransferase (adenine-specific) n=3 Tax=Brachyspira aalborgi TaxID=29522 RepID=A0A5C8G1X6_9SPIR|nr:type I restriction-modification system subunit M [Brachyspira aalborgi]TXJ56023.1 type I restriction-modification system subunit M [Brachyspira aalborgi]
MQKKTTKETVENIVWKACDTFRGSIDSSLYKDYILSMLFVKYLSDFAKEKIKELESKYSGDKLKRRLERMNYKISKDASFEYLLKNKEAPNIGEIINTALRKIERDNPQKFDGIFNNIDFNDSNKFGETKTRNAILKHLLEDFSDSELDLSPSALQNNDVMGDAYEYLISNFASDAGKKGGEFFTPPEVSTLIAKIVSDRTGVKIYDPTCGSGSLLIKVNKEIGRENCTIYGQEKNSQTFALCRMNMYLHEIGDEAKIEWGDTIKEPKFTGKGELSKFDVVVANPPFSLDKWGEEIALNDKYNRFEFGVPPKSKGDLAFLLHMINSMKENGITAVVMPHGVLFREAGEGFIREKIIENNLIDTIIGLPPNLFYGTSIPACIIVLKNNRKNKDIFFIDASEEYDKGKRQNKLREEDISKILTAYRKRKDILKYCRAVSFEEIKANNYNLNISRYLISAEEKSDINLNTSKREIDNLETEREKLRNSINNIFKEIKI